MKRPLMISLSLNHSPTQSPGRLYSPSWTPRNPFCSSERQVGTSRVDEVVDQCRSLRGDLSTNYLTLKGRVDDSISQLHQVRKRLFTTAPRGWKDSPKYLQGKMRIKQAEQLEEDRHLDAQVSMLRNLAAGSEVAARSVKLTLTKTQMLKGKKAKNVRESLFLPMRMLDKFSIAHHLAHSQRPFGSISPVETDGIFTFLQDEIAKYEKERRERALAGNKQVRNARTSATTALNRRLMAEAQHQTGSPLQSYVQQYQERRLMGESLTQRRRKAKEEKMRAIQPSPEVRALSQKYLPKYLRMSQPKRKSSSPQRLRAADVSSEVSSNTSSTESLSHDQHYIAGEIQKELTNIDSLLRIATMVKEKNRQDLIKKMKKK